MNSSLPTPSLSPAKAPPQRSPPSAEDLCLRTFRSCWFLDRDWLISFAASAQRVKPDAPITWVEFMPKGHTHLVRSTLKLVPVSKHLPLAKIKEVMFTFLLETLNAPGSPPGFFNARKAAKPRTRTRKRKSEGKQSVAMAIDAPPSNSNPPPPSTGNPSGSTPAPSAGAGNGGDKGEICPGPSSEAPGTRGKPVTPCASDPPDFSAPLPLRGSAAYRERLLAENAALIASAASTRAPSPSPSITSILGKRSSPPPPTSPPPPVGSPIPQAPQDWRAWMEWKRALYSDRNPDRPVPAVVTPLDLREAAQAARPTPILSPPSLCPLSPPPLLSAPPLLQTPPRGKTRKLRKPSA